MKPQKLFISLVLVVLMELLVPATGRIYGDTTPFQPVIQMEDAYEYGADIDQYPIARVQIAGCTLTPDDYDGNVYTVERDGTEIGEVRVYYSKEKDMAQLQKALAEALSDPEGFEDPDEGGGKGRSYAGLSDRQRDQPLQPALRRLLFQVY